MRKLLLLTVLTLASFAPASAHQTATVSAQQTATVDSNPAYTSLGGDRPMNCYNPYIGDWKHGYPRDDDSC
jgi:hypothetical protein